MNYTALKNTPKNVINTFDRFDRLRIFNEPWVNVLFVPKKTKITSSLIEFLVFMTLLASVSQNITQNALDTGAGN